MTFSRIRCPMQWRRFSQTPCTLATDHFEVRECLLKSESKCMSTTIQTTKSRDNFVFFIFAHLPQTFVDCGRSVVCHRISNTSKRVLTLPIRLGRTPYVQEFDNEFDVSLGSQWAHMNLKWTHKM